MRTPSVRKIAPRCVHVFVPGIRTYGAALWLEWRPSDRLAGFRAWPDGFGRRRALGAWWAKIELVVIPLREHEAGAWWLDRIARR